MTPSSLPGQEVPATPEAAIWQRDPAKAAHILALLEQGRAGRVLQAWQVEMQAAAAALAGGGEAAGDGFLQARRLWQELGARWQAALNRAHFALLCPQHVDAAAAAGEVRSLARDMGTPTLVTLLDSALGVGAAR
ncbi:MAG: hypothetical protein H6Q11_186 [Acidobacteria bacterium]|nr:hypothetical protein [Acidobacteriota bacterium]